MMTLKEIAISDIGIVDRLRSIDEEHAKAIAISIADIGLIQPITVRSTPAAKTGKFTLVAGGHRLRACQLCGLERIDVVVMKADKDDAQVLEIAENFYRNELSKLDRAIFVGRMREIWEAKNGAINPRGGRPKKNTAQFTAFFTGKFSSFVADRLGVGNRTAELLDEISRKLHPRLRAKIKGTAAADNLTILKKLKSMPEAKQTALAAAMDDEPDLKKVLAMDKPPRVKLKPENSTADAALIMQQWLMAPDEERAKFCKWAGIDWQPPVRAEKPVKAKSETAKTAPIRKPAKPKPKSNAGRKPDSEQVKWEKQLQRFFIEDLRAVLLEKGEQPDAKAFAFMKAQDAVGQFDIACHIGNGHSMDLDDLKWRIKRSREDREAEQEPPVGQQFEHAEISAVAEKAKGEGVEADF